MTPNRELVAGREGAPLDDTGRGAPNALPVLHAGFGDSKYRPALLLTEVVAAGQLGRKTGKGFHTYS